MARKETTGWPDWPMKSRTRKGKYGIKAYGTWFCFNGKRKYEEYLTAWSQNTEGSERERATRAFIALWSGRRFFNSDS